MDFEDLSPELQEKAKACKNTAEIIELAKNEGIEVSDEQLEAIAGGNWCHACTVDPFCPGDCPKDY